MNNLQHYTLGSVNRRNRKARKSQRWPRYYWTYRQSWERFCHRTGRSDRTGSYEEETMTVTVEVLS